MAEFLSAALLLQINNIYFAQECSELSSPTLPGLLLVMIERVNHTNESRSAV